MSKKTGMPIKEIKVFIDWCIEGDTTISKRKELIEKQRQVVLFQIQQLKETLSMLDYKNGIMKLRKKQAHVKYMKQCKKMRFLTVYEKQENGQKVFLLKNTNGSYPFKGRCRLIFSIYNFVIQGSYQKMV